MRPYKSIVAGVVILAAVGCGNKDNNGSDQNPNIQKDTSYSQHFHEESKLGGYNSFEGGSGVGVGDMDGDGDLDIIVADRGAYLHYLENIDGKFKDRGKITEGKNNFSGDSDLTLADIDKDGDLDIIYTDRAAYVHIVKNNIPQKDKQ